MIINISITWTIWWYGIWIIFLLESSENFTLARERSQSSVRRSKQTAVRQDQAAKSGRRIGGWVSQAKHNQSSGGFVFLASQSVSSSSINGSSQEERSQQAASYRSALSKAISGRHQEREKAVRWSDQQATSSKVEESMLLSSEA